MTDLERKVGVIINPLKTFYSKLNIFIAHNDLNQSLEANPFQVEMDLLVDTLSKNISDQVARDCYFRLQSIPCLKVFLRKILQDRELNFSYILVEKSQQDQPATFQALAFRAITDEDLKAILDDKSK